MDDDIILSSADLDVLSERCAILVTLIDSLPDGTVLTERQLADLCAEAVAIQRAREQAE